MQIDRSGTFPALDLAPGQVAVEPTAAPSLTSNWAVYGLGIALQVGTFAYFCWMFGDNPFDLAKPAGLLAAVALFLPLHELLHGLLHPKLGLSRDTRFGLEKKHFLPYCVYTRPHSKARAVLALLTPFVVLTGVPVVLALFGACPPWLAVLAVLNVVGCGGDLLYAAFIVRQLPAGAQMGYDRGEVRVVR